MERQVRYCYTRTNTEQCCAIDDVFNGPAYWAVIDRVREHITPPVPPAGLEGAANTPDWADAIESLAYAVFDYDPITCWNRWSPQWDSPDGPKPVIEIIAIMDRQED